MSDVSNKKRIDWIDFAKGIAIILTIVGHTIDEGKYGSILRGVIFSFHMPLFFMLSLITYRCSETVEEFKQKTIKAFKHLIIPAIVVVCVMIIMELVRNHGLLLDTHYWKSKVYMIVFASGVPYTFNWEDVNALGVAWFLVALFAGRTMFDYIHVSFGDDSKVGVISAIMGIVGVMLGKNYHYLPFSLDIALAVIPFMFIGHIFQKIDINSKPMRKIIIYGIVWIGTLYLIFPHWENKTYMELAARNYNMFPVCYLTAFAGSMVLSELSVLMCKIKYLPTPLIFVGKNSLYLLCIHILDWQFAKLWNHGQSQYITAIIRVGIDLGIFICIIGIKTLIGTLKHNK